MLDDVRDALLSDAAGLPAGPCPACGREVLAYVVPDADAERYACVHCDGPVRRVYLVGESELDDLGYALTDPLRPQGGCATGCANGGCGVKRTD
jgi:hypothetical protein